MASCALPGSQNLAVPVSADVGAPLRRLRFAAGMVLAGHFAMHALRTVPLLANPGLFDPGLAPSTIRSSALAAGLSATILRGIFVTGVSLCVGIATSRVPRACAAIVFALALATYWALFPVTIVDDSVACWASLLLLLLPNKAHSAPSAQNRTTELPSRAVVTCLLGCVLVLEVSGTIARISGLEGPLLAGVLITVRVAAVCLIAPSAGLRALGTVALVSLHVYLACVTASPLLNGALATTGALFWGGRSREPKRRRPPLDAGGLVAIALLVGLVLALGGNAVGSPAIAAGATRVLVDAGLLSSNISPRDARGRVLTLTVATADGAEVVGLDDWEAVSVSRRSLVAAHLNWPKGSPFRAALGSRLAARYCKKRGGNPSDMRVLAADGNPVAEFACDGARVAAFLQRDLPRSPPFDRDDTANAEAKQ